ncbi:hypothetical protein Efla_000062 [Eimeria flavescens]
MPRVSQKSEGQHRQSAAVVRVLFSSSEHVVLDCAPEKGLSGGRPLFELEMELIYAVGTPEGGACALVASYAYPPGGVTISALGQHAAKAAGKAVRLHTADGCLENPLTIIRYLCDKSDARTTLLGPEKNPADQAVITQWLSFCASRGFQVSSSGDLNEFNSALQLNTFICGNTISAADLIAMASLHAAMKKASAKELQMVKNVTRWFNHMQNLPGVFFTRRSCAAFFFRGCMQSPVNDVLKAAEEAQKKAKNQHQGRQQQKASPSGEKRADAEGKKKTDAAGKQKGKASGAAKTEERPVEDPMRLELRVGLVKRVWRHPEADKLYCEEIDFGSLGVRQIASGLVPYLPKEEFEGKKVIVLFNLKAKPLRGFESHGMVMCASSEDKSSTELLLPPADTPLGERVVVQGLEGEADEVLSSKKGKDPLAACSPFLRTKDNCGAYFKDLPLVTTQGPVKCSSIKGGYIS